MYDIASALESYTIPEYEIATEGLVDGVIKVILTFLKSFKGKLLAIVSAIVAILVASKKKGSDNGGPTTKDDIEPPIEEPPATNNKPEIPQLPAPTRNSRYKPGPKVRSAERGTRDEIRERNEAAKKAKELQNMISKILSNINRGFTATKASLDLLVKYRGKHATAENTDSLLDYGGEIDIACQNIDQAYQYYNDSYYAGIKISLDGPIYKNLANQKRSMETMIKMLDGLIKRYTSDKNFQQDNPDNIKNFISKIPKKATNLVARITKTLTVIKTHS